MCSVVGECSAVRACLYLGVLTVVVILCAAKVNLRGNPCHKFVVGITKCMLGLHCFNLHGCLYVFPAQCCSSRWLASFPTRIQCAFEISGS